MPAARRDGGINRRGWCFVAFAGRVRAVRFWVRRDPRAWDELYACHLAQVALGELNTQRRWQDKMDELELAWLRGQLLTFVAGF